MGVILHILQPKGSRKQGHFLHVIPQKQPLTVIVLLAVYTRSIFYRSRFQIYYIQIQILFPRNKSRSRSKSDLHLVEQDSSYTRMRRKLLTQICAMCLSKFVQAEQNSFALFPSSSIQFTRAAPFCCLRAGYAQTSHRKKKRAWRRCFDTWKKSRI